MVSLKVIFTLFFIHVCSGGKGGSRFRIISGRLADIGEFPYQVSIEYQTNQWCGGSIYTPRVVITAAHCIQIVRHLRSIPDRTMQVRVGSSVASGGGVLHGIHQIIPHENYNKDPTVDEHDIALLILKTAIKFNDKAQPIPLARADPPDGTKAYVTGYGRQDPMRRASPQDSAGRHLMVVEIPIMNRGKCKNIHKAYGNTVTEKMICAGGNAGSKDSCKGDSGGPLVIDNKLVGVVAWGIGCGREGMPGVYTDVPFYREWILENVKKAERSLVSRRSEKNVNDILYRLFLGKSMWA